MSYERKCPVCGETFITKHPQKRICCAECVAEYDDIKRYIYGRMKEKIIDTINEARTTFKNADQLAKEFIKKC